jgi:20S proteasome alpha/beta subunit
MTRKLLIAVITVIVLVPILYLTIGTFTAHCDDGIRHGTVVIVSMDADSIIMAADSRETNIAFREKKVTFADTAQKIFRISNTFFAIAGLSELCKTSTRAFVTRIYDTTRSIKENMPVIEAKLKKALQTELDSYNRKQKNYLAGHEYSIVLYITGYEKGVPTLCGISAGVKFVTLFANPVQAYANTGTGSMFGLAGITDHIAEVGLNLDSNKVQRMTNLILLEARHHTEVDSLIQYVIIKKEGYRTGSNFTRPATHR